MADVVVKLQSKVQSLSKASPPSPDLTADDIHSGCLKLGMKKATADFFKGQLKNCNRKAKGRRFTVQERTIAIGILFRGKQAYRLISELFIMPSVCSLYRYVRALPISPGINPAIINLMKTKVAMMDEPSRYCLVTFDEMALKSEFRYNAASDEVDGLVHLVHPEAKPANQALVFMARSLYSRWKQPVAFFFSENAAGAKDIATILKDLLSQLLSIGLLPTVIVCDQGSCNRSLYRHMGITYARPFFMFQGRKIFAVHDVPHILKNVRNTLKAADITFGHNQVQVASWDDVNELFKHDQGMPVRMVPKLTCKHIYLPPFSTMRVSLAAQVLSRTVYAAISTLVSLEKWPGKRCPMGTATFAKTVNDIFDFLNVRSFSKIKQPLRGDSADAAKIRGFMSEVETWRVKGKVARQPCFEALLQSLNAMLLMSEELIHHGPFQFLLTGRINQDCLENFFAQVRARGGHRINPTSKEFMFAYRAIMANMLMCSVPTANCTADGDFPLSSLKDFASASTSSTSTKRPLEDADTPSSQPPPKKRRGMATISDFTLTSPVVNVVAYIGGYVITKVKALHHCQSCLKVVTDSTHNSTNLLTSFKAFGSMQYPSAGCLNFLASIEVMFQMEIAQLTATKGLLQCLVNKASGIKCTLPLCDVHSSSIRHHLALFYLRCRLHYHFKFESRKLLQMKTE